MHWGAWGGGGWFMMIFWWGLIILGLVLLVGWIIRQTSQSNQGKSSMDILKERYAKGEISKEEFDEKKKDIQ